MKKYIMTLTSKGNHKSQKILNALILLGCDEGEYLATTSPAFRFEPNASIDFKLEGPAISHFHAHYNP